MTATIPAELTERPQWVCWRYEQRGGKTTKAPIDAKSNGRLAHAKSNDSATWASYAEAVATCERYPELAGVGFCFSPDDGLTGIDLDHVIDPDTGELKPEAAEIIQRFQGTYTEVSPSGTGWRLFCYGKPGRSGKNAGPVKWCEVYDHRSPSHLTVTGDHWTGSATAVTEQQAALDWLHSRFMTASTGQEPVASKPGPAGALDLDDATLLDKARNAKNGAEFAALWAGDTSGHGGDDSAADLALCNRLAFWTNGDADRIDRLFRQSGLMRLKWDSPRGEFDTYGSTTINKAIDGCRATYSGCAGVRSEAPAGTVAGNPKRETADDRQLVGPLKMKRGEVAATYQNAVRILQFAPFSESIAYNRFAGRLQRIAPMPWNDEPGDWGDMDTSRLMLWAAEHHNVDFTAEVMERALAVTADDHAFNLAQDRLRELADQWDGVSRLTTWLADYLNVELTLTNREYLAEIGAAWLKGVAARVLFPGCKRDDVLTLVGPQGYRKSTAAAAIADCICPNSFTDSLGNLGSDEASIGVIGTTIAEFSELSAVARSELEAVKSFVSRSSDRFREKYARHQTDHPRTCSFIATTNEDCGFLRDPSGNRRWWPVTITTQINVEQLAFHLPQLLGEAARRVIDGEPWHVTDAVALAQADEIREDNSDRDVWEAAVLAAMDVLLPHERTTAKVLGYIGVRIERQDQQTKKRVSGILCANGWKNKRGRIPGPGGKRSYIWRLSPSHNEGGQEGDTSLSSQQAGCPYVPICPPHKKDNYMEDEAVGVTANSAVKSAGEVHREFYGDKGDKGDKSPPSPDSSPVDTPPSAETTGSGDTPDISPDIASASPAENQSGSGGCKAKAADIAGDTTPPPS
nr:VapE family protein [Candidatus Competibacter phosphatis]HMR03634.1 VapE family protein [Candidatus Competibacter phosphatis]